MDLLSEDRELLAAFRAGTPEALDRVYRHHVSGLAAFLRRGFLASRKGGQPSTVRLSEPFELENAVQEVFVRAFRESARLSYDGLRPYRDFLFGVARHVVIDELRRRERRPEGSSTSLETMDLEPVSDDPEGSLEDGIARKEAVETVDRFLKNECDERDRALYSLRFSEDLSQEAAAERAGLTRIQVRRWEDKFRARVLRYLKRVKYV